MHPFSGSFHCCSGCCSSASMAVTVGLLLTGCATEEIGVHDIYEESIPVDAMSNPLDMSVVYVFEASAFAIDGVLLSSLLKVRSIFRAIRQTTGVH